jgi:UDP-N-acetylglucosamine 2-epimerase
MPNSDAQSSVIRRYIIRFVETHPSAWCIENFGTQDYFGVMRFSAVMVGNSSSGIIEAPSFGLPVINIGTRQAGRVRAANVLDIGYARSEIVTGIKCAIAPKFREGLRNLTNPYGGGYAAEYIVDGLKAVALDDHLIFKVFHDLGVTE